MAGRFVLFTMALIGAIFTGTLAGNAAVAGMNGSDQGYALPQVGDEQAMLADAAEQAAQDRQAVLVSGETTHADCLDCSDYEAGYRWAAAHAVTQAGGCDGDSEAFTDGCAAYVGDGVTAGHI